MSCSQGHFLQLIPRSFFSLPDGHPIAQLIVHMGKGLLKSPVKGPRILYVT